MLVLTRREGEKIRIGPDVLLIVSRIEGNKVSLAFDAPAEVPIVRTEIESQGDSRNA